eukprot:1575628-Rhodomonas_salina.5
MPSLAVSATSTSTRTTPVSRRLAGTAVMRVTCRLPRGSVDTAVRVSHRGGERQERGEGKGKAEEAEERRGRG